MTTIRIGAIIDMSRSEHARLRSLHGADFPARIEPWVTLLWIMAAARRPAPAGRVEVERVVLGLVGDAHAVGRLDSECIGWVLAALEEHCEQERLGTTLLYEAQAESATPGLASSPPAISDHHGGTKSHQGPRREAGGP